MYSKTDFTPYTAIKMKIKAKFKGVDKRKKPVYKTGKKYSLNFEVADVFNTTKEHIEINIWNEWEGISAFWYPSLKKFLENWEIL